MIQEYQIRVLPEQAANEQTIKTFICKDKGIDARTINAIRVLKRSIDARQRTIYVNLKVRLYINEMPQDEEFVHTIYQNVEDKPQVIVVGAGPGKGYLQVTFKPFSNYQYRRKEYEKKVETSALFEIFNYSRKTYMPIIELINYGDEETINKIGEMEIKGLKNGEKIIIDNLSKIVQDKDGLNKFSCCNRKWLELKPKTTNQFTASGNCGIKIICEFPIVK